MKRIDFIKSLGLGIALISTGFVGKKEIVIRGVNGVVSNIEMTIDADKEYVRIVDAKIVEYCGFKVKNQRGRLTLGQSRINDGVIRFSEGVKISQIHSLEGFLFPENQ